MSNENIKIIRSGKNDRTEILTLLENAKGDHLTPDERAHSGFIQGNIDEELLEKFQNNLGVYVAKSNNEIAAVAFTSNIGITQQGPIVKASRVVLDMCKDLSSSDIFQYGPVVVKSEFKGKGLLSRLLLFLCSEIGKNYKKGLAFVEDANQLSLNIHRHYFEREFASFQFKERKYYIFLFDPAALLQKYQSK